MRSEIKVFIEFDELAELQKHTEFLPIFHYNMHELTQPNEVGKIDIVGGPLLRFYLKIKGINPLVLITILEGIYNMGKKIPFIALDKLPQVIKFLKENT